MHEPNIVNAPVSVIESQIRAYLCMCFSSSDILSDRLHISFWPVMGCRLTNLANSFENPASSVLNRMVRSTRDLVNAACSAEI